MRQLLCLWVCLVVAVPAAATGSVQMAVRLPATEVAAGQVLRFAIILINPDGQTAAAQLPEVLPVRLYPPGAKKPVSREATSESGAGRVVVPAGRFQRVFYHLELPEDMVGAVTLEVAQLPVQPLVFTARSARAVEPDPAISRLDRLAENFFGHEPVYFLVGSDPTHAKFQISFKYRLLNPEGSLARRWQRLENIYFGYTQTSFWDWESDSAPFYDSSYKPELFYYRPDVPQDTIGWISRFSFQGGILHESNGKDGTESRSLNMIYIRPGVLIDTGAASHFFIAPRIWTYVGDLDDNPDIDRYRGYFDLETSWEKRDSWKLATLLRKGTGSGKGSAQIDATYPLGEFLAGNLDIYLQFQYYTGYAETLRAYDQRYDFFRVGLALFR